MRVAIVGAGHWHVPMYVKALQSLDVEIVGVQDWSEETLAKVGETLDCPRYTCFQDMLAERKPDFVFAHAPHDEMTGLASVLVARHQPFHMEKPMGVEWRQLERVAVKAQTEKLFVSVPLVSRYYAPVQRLREMRLAGALGKPVHYYYRLFAGRPDRYREMGVEWMLDPTTAGGGPLFNFGPHVIDLYLYLMEDEVREVSARQIRPLHDLPIEDLTTLTLIGKQGSLGIAEVSYTMPHGYARNLSVNTAAVYYGGDVTGGTLALDSGEELALAGIGADDAYAHYTEDTLRRFAAGEPPIADIADMAAILRIINAAQESANIGRPVKLGQKEDEE
jgi:predicted dehydrogenase